MLRGLIAAMLGSAVAVTTAHAADLMDVYQLAQQSDPTLQKAAATRDAVEQNKPLALAALLPHLSAGANYQKSKSEGTTTQFNAVTGAYVTTPSTNFDSTRKGYSINLQQSIFDWTNWLSLSKAEIQVAQAEVNYGIAQQDLIVRVSQAYFNVLAAKDTLRAAQANQKALGKQLQQAKKKYDVGLSAITDVQEVQAAYDQAHAQVIAERQALINAEDALIAITGVPVGDLQEPAAELPLNKPEPANAQAWIDQAIHGNLSLVASRMDTKIAAKNVDIQQAVRYPTLGLSLSHGRNLGSTTFGPQRPQTSQDTGNTLSLQFSLPIWSGGAISARSRQAKYNRVAAEAQTHIVARQVKRRTRDAFLGVLTGIAKVKALREAVISAETALRANEAGLKVGTRTTVDVLTARNNLLEARTNYAQARYQYLLDGLLLQQAAGTLGSPDVVAINQYLTGEPLAPGETAQPAAPEGSAGNAESQSK
ncbi:MAG TPA: TolC family outer membrane protein [Gammaproteobacteria bacterium]|nr:TolC family outer membrane protein [Gammaproteobacteria bacterium]